MITLHIDPDTAFRGRRAAASRQQSVAIVIWDDGRLDWLGDDALDEIRAQIDENAPSCREVARVQPNGDITSEYELI